MIAITRDRESRERDLRNALWVDGKEVHNENERQFISWGWIGISLLENFQA